jgi:hypothetical protein
VLLLSLLFCGTTATAMQLGEAAANYPSLTSTFRQSVAHINLEHAVTALGPQSLATVAAGGGGSSSVPPPSVPRHPHAGDCVTPFLPHGAVDPDPGSELTQSKDHGWWVGNHSGLTPARRAELDALLLERKHKSFAYALADMPGYHGKDGDFSIELTHNEPIISKKRRYSPAECRVRDEKCCELRDAGFIVRAPPNCQYQCAPTMPCKKAPDGSWSDHRFCIDYRPVNACTKADRYGLHLPEDLFRQVGDARVYSKIDLRGAFNQIVVEEGSRPCTAFQWGNEVWMYTRMPYGLVSGSAKCQRVMDTEIALAGLQHCALCFVDDLLVYSDTVEEHMHGALHCCSA